MDDAELEVRREIADALDRRRQEIAQILRIVSEFRGRTLESVAARMAIPLIYAHWEGFVKESFRLYVTHVEAQKPYQREVCSALLAYSWTPTIKKLAANLTFEKQVELTTSLLACLTERLKFGEAEREIDTRSNLVFDVLEALCRRLNVDVGPLRPYKARINSLVSQRNHIAHGGRHGPIGFSEIGEMADMTRDLMQAVEARVGEAIVERRYKREAGDPCTTG